MMSIEVRCLIIALSLFSCTAFNQISLNSLFGQQTSKSPAQLKTVAITGASGLVGSALKKKLESRNIKVLSIGRNSGNDADSIQWDLANGITDLKKLENVDAIVHLAGEGVASGSGALSLLGRWDGDKKDKILGSRVIGTKLIVDALSKLKKKPGLFISASAVGYYPYNSDTNTVYTESSSKGEGFLADVCEQWEQEALQADKLGIRTVCTRFGIILSSNGGILKKLLPLFQVGGGGVIGSGKQGFSAVSINDAVNALDYILTNYKSKADLKGVVNVCSPQPTDNEGFTKAFGRYVDLYTLCTLLYTLTRLK